MVIFVPKYFLFIRIQTDEVVSVLTVTMKEWIISGTVCWQYFYSVWLLFTTVLFSPGSNRSEDWSTMNKWSLAEVWFLPESPVSLTTWLWSHWWRNKKRKKLTKWIWTMQSTWPSRTNQRVSNAQVKPSIVVIYYISFEDRYVTINDTDSWNSNGIKLDNEKINK